MNVLFICTANKDRSVTAQKLFKTAGAKHVRSAGTSATAHIRVSKSLLRWADVIFAMESHHVKFLRASFPDETRDKRIECLNIPDEYHLMSHELIEILNATLRVSNGEIELIT